MPDQLLAPATRAAAVIATRPVARRAVRTAPVPARDRGPAAGPAAARPAITAGPDITAARPVTTGLPATAGLPVTAPAGAPATVPAAAPAGSPRTARERPWSVARRPRPVAPLPCQSAPELFFAEKPEVLKEAQALCQTCPAREECLAGALKRGEPCGVWGGKLFMFGNIIDSKRPRGRPRRVAA
jgi:WhiB family transcriptional regulator, redox-sensing transcriptional regulator